MAKIIPRTWQQINNVAKHKMGIYVNGVREQMKTNQTIKKKHNKTKQNKNKANQTNDRCSEECVVSCTTFVLHGSSRTLPWKLPWKIWKLPRKKKTRASMKVTSTGASTEVTSTGASTEVTPTKASTEASMQASTKVYSTGASTKASTEVTSTNQFQEQSYWRVSSKLVGDTRAHLACCHSEIVHRNRTG